MHSLKEHCKRLIDWTMQDSASDFERVFKFGVLFSLFFNFVNSLVLMLSGEVIQGMESAISTIAVNVLFLIIIKGVSFKRQRVDRGE